MIRLSGALAVLIMLFYAAPVHAQKSSPCAPSTRVPVKVTFEHKQHPIQKDVTSRTLTGYMQETDKESVFAQEAKWMVGGLHDGRISTAYAMAYMIRTNPDGTVCATPNAFTYDVIFENKIYIAEDYKKLGCRYSATMAHERLHEKTDLKFAKEYVRDAQTVLEQALAGVKPIGPMSKEALPAAREALSREIASKTKPLFDAMSQKRNAAHSEIDSYQNYMRSSALCPGQFPRFDQ